MCMDNNSMMDKMFGCFKENYGYISERESMEEMEKLSDDQLKMINISEHNRLEAYFLNYFSKEEYMDMPFYRLAQFFNHRKYPIPRYFSVDIYKEKNVGILTVTCIGVTIVPEMLEMLTQCQASILANAMGRFNEMMLTFTCKLFPNDESDEKTE